MDAEREYETTADRIAALTSAMGLSGRSIKVARQHHMSDRSEKFWTFVGVVLVCCAFVLCLSVLVTAIKLSVVLFAPWVIIAFQIFATVCGTAASAAFTLYVVGSAMSSVSGRIGKLARENREAVAKLQQAIRFDVS